MDTQNPEYNPIFELILEFGRVCLETPGLTRYRDELDAEIREIAKHTSVRTVVSENIPVLRRNIKKGAEFWTNDIHLAMEPGDSMWQDAQDSLSVMDLSLYFLHAFLNLDEHIFNGSKEDFVNKADTIYSEIISQTDPDEHFSFLRMIPLNTWRSTRLSELRDDLHYLYPWYEYMSDMPDDLLISLYNCWPDVKQGDFTGMPLPDAYPPDMIRMELAADPMLYDALEQAWARRSALYTALNSRLDLRLWHQSDLQGYQQIVPDEQVQIGLVRLALKFLEQPTADPIERIGRVFQTAFCGPLLSEKDRISAFQWVVKEVSDLTQEVKPVSDEAALVGLLQDWMGKRVEDGDLGQRVFEKWEARMALLAVGERAKADLAVEELSDRLEGLISGRAVVIPAEPPKLSPLRDMVTGKIIPWLTEMISAPLVQLSYSAQTCSEKDASVRTRPIETKRVKEITISKPENWEGVFSFHGDQDLENFLDDLARKTDEYFWGGMILSTDATVEVWEVLPVPDFKRPVDKMRTPVPKDCAFLIAGVYNNPDHLEDMINKIAESLKTLDMPDMQEITDAEPIVWICYMFEYNLA